MTESGETESLFTLDGRVAVVTGGASGIGAGMAILVKGKDRYFEPASCAPARRGAWWPVRHPDRTRVPRVVAVLRSAPLFCAVLIGASFQCWGSSLRRENGPSWPNSARLACTYSETVSGLLPLMTSTRLFSPAKMPSR